MGPFIPDDDGLGDEAESCPGCGADTPSACECLAESILAAREFDAAFPPD
jgi:hypothetical protein